MSRIYGILDCAIDPGLHEHAARLEPEAARCLFLGDLDPVVKAASPYLIDLTADDRLRRRWRDEGWTSNWGILIESSASLNAVWRRLRHFTQAILPSGEGPVLFRFWDPRVLRVFMPLVEPSDLPGWFQDIDAYIVPAEDGGALRFGYEDHRLSTRSG
jgi:hypothetical protein